jgi:hypothetical protein
MRIGWLLSVVAIVTSAHAAGPAAAPASPVPDRLPTVEATSSVTLDFPVGMTITADLEWDPTLGPTEVVLLYTVANDPTERLALVDVPIEEGVPSVSTTADLDLQYQFVPSGVPISFWWRLEHDQEVIAESLPESSLWFDDRWDWTEVSSDQVRVYTYDHSEAFANEILDSAQSTITTLENQFSLEESAPLDIWVYPNSEDFRGAQRPNSRESVAGASYPGYELVVVMIPDGNSAEVGRVIPHEISHQVLHQATDNPFTYPPLWFDEGLATHFQVGGTDGYAEMVARALEEDALYDLTSLEVSFPYGPSEATLAYAASWSAIEYLQVTYGNESIGALIEAFAAGTGYDEAIENALGIDASQLNAAWQDWIRASSG